MKKPEFEDYKYTCQDDTSRTSYYYDSYREDCRRYSLTQEQREEEDEQDELMFEIHNAIKTITKIVELYWYTMNSPILHEWELEDARTLTLACNRVETLNLKLKKPYLCSDKYCKCEEYYKWSPDCRQSAIITKLKKGNALLSAW